MRYSLFLSVRKGRIVLEFLASELNRRTSWVVDVFRRPSFSHCIDSGELIRSQFPGENPFWIETESWGRKAPDGRAKLGRLTSALLGALSHVFHKLGTLASNGDVGANPADSYLVDPASSHMLVSKIKPCTCK